MRVYGSAVYRYCRRMVTDDDFSRAERLLKEAEPLQTDQDAGIIQDPE